MYILAFDECALSILLIFIISGIVRREYNSQSNLLMQLLLWLIFVCFNVDIMIGHLSNMGLERYRLLIYILYYFYFFLINLIYPVYQVYMQTSIDVWHIINKNRHFFIFTVIMIAVNTLALALNGWCLDVFSLSENLIMVKGPWMAVFYITNNIWNVYSIMAMHRYYRYINKDKWKVMFLLFTVIMAGFIVQMFNPMLKIEGFTLAIAMLFYLVLVKREESQLDPISGAFSYTEGLSRVRKNLESGKPISVIFFKLVNNDNIHLFLGAEGYNDFLRNITGTIRDIEKENGISSEIFYMENGLYAIMGDDGKQKRRDVVKTAETIRERFSSEIHMDDFTIIPKTSICIAFCPEDIHDLTTMTTFATSYHETLTDSKKIYFYSETKGRRNFMIHNEIDEIIKRGLEHNGFKMYYQPIYSVVEQRFVAAEALIRLNDRNYGLISPALFIPVAETIGAIHQIGDFVLEEVCRFISETDMRGLGIDYIEMNLSSAQCLDSNLFEKIRSKMEEKNVSPDLVSFELTEAATDINPAIVDENMRRLHDLGVRIALDNYGTGYSNIMRVTQLPFDQIKFDKKFVDLIDKPDMWIVIRDTVAMLKEMGKEVLMEGVEDEAVVNKFTGAGADLIQGCDLIQGFYYCKPLPKEDFVRFMKEYRK